MLPAYHEELTVLQGDIARYLASGSEEDLEIVELKLAAGLIAMRSSACLLVWNHVNGRPEQFELTADARRNAAARLEATGR